MKVKIGDTWYSAEDQPISVMFEDEELECIKQMDRDSSPNLRFTAGRLDDQELLDWAKS
ncbi:hypothetical protein [Pseudomonas sp. A25(2017)]|uniref:hypothetical protein n=1 Tax=Pseudomonas sp. A25(2017) TaxID=1945865 RepID=UPI00143DDBE0|nr:hypothetical protein [Pseudomonas sp. A25(2017)]